LFSQVPLVAVSVSPTALVPLIVGGVFATGTTLTGELGASGEPAPGAKTIAGSGLGACGDLGLAWLGLRRWRVAQQHDGWRRRWRLDAADLVVRRRWASRHARSRRRCWRRPAAADDDRLGCLDPPARAPGANSAHISSMATTSTRPCVKGLLGLVDLPVADVGACATTRGNDT
jgi:hypothetical protein